MSRLDLTLVREYEAALAWWQAAGVDCDFSDDVTAWLADAPVDAPLEAPGQAARNDSEARRGAAAGNRFPQADERRRGPAHAALAEPPAVAARPNLLGDSPPADLAAFRRWWMDAPGLAPSSGFARVPSRGPAGAPLMVLVPQPEAEDRERLLSGPQGRLLAAILAAMGLVEDEVVVAAALPCHTPMADLPALASAGMEAVTLHHIALAGPQRIVAFGTGLAAMLGAASNDGLREINQTGRKNPVIVSETLDAMMDMPRLKRRFWRRWMEWSPTQ